MSRSFILGALVLAAGPLALSAQSSTPLPEDTANALVLEPNRTLRFTTDEGTWISLDVSPDGESIVFDLLGDLYTIPMGGGTATRITEGMPWDGMPRWSPDGATIAFISDRDGGDNIWLVSPDGANLRKLTAEQTHSFSSPAWSPDGEYLVARRFGQYPSAENYLTNVPLWIVHVDGGSGTQVFPTEASRKSTNTGPAFSPDGKTMYFSSHAGGYSGATVGAYQVLAVDLTTGEDRTLTAGAGGGLRPVTSPDGRWLVYATRVNAHTALRIRDLQTHEDEWLAEGVQRDDQEGYAPNDILPGYAFTPDSRAVVFSGGGKIQRVDITTREVTNVPFTVNVELGMAERLQLPLTVDDSDSVPVTQLQFVTESPDGSQVAFSAVGRLYTAPLRNGQAGATTRLTGAATKEYFPAYSPDGRWIAYATWQDSVGGHLWKTRANGQGTPVRLTTEPATIRAPRWSPEGDRIVYSWSPRRAGLGAGPVASLSELRSVSADGGASFTIAHTGSRPALVTAGEITPGRVYYTENIPNPQPGFNATRTTALVSMRLDGTKKRTHARLTSPNSGGVILKPAPDERAMLVLERDDLYVLPLAPAGEEGLAVNIRSPSVPLRRLTTEGANYAEWASGGSRVMWSFANHIFHASREAVMASPDSTAWEKTETEITLHVARAIPRGELLLRGARIITMNGEEIIDRGDVLIHDNRIAAVGRNLSAAAATVMDVNGATIIPGIVDTHAHPRTGAEMAPDQEWSIASNLAYGVTTTRNPSGSRWNVAWGELIETGQMVGSRIWATGFPLTSNNVRVNSYEDALSVVRRYKNQGVHSIKQYLQPRRIQRQWILQAGRAAGINVTNEGAADLRMDISMAVDGFSGLEHSIGQVPLYKDVVTVLADARIAYTPTLTVAYGAPGGDGYFRARTDLHEDPKTSYFTPAETLARGARRRPMIVEEDYNFDEIARGVRDVVRAGGLAGLGSHGQQDGIAAHWELWMLQSGDMTNHEALKIATIVGAESIGYRRDLGSIEEGKLADLIVLNSNPLDDIRNSTDIRYVIKNGELYDADTLDRIWPGPKPFPTPYWVRERMELERLPGRQ